VACRILSRNGYVVLTSGNGPEAIALVERHTAEIDLLLTDVIMPKMLGKEVAARIQEFRPGLPVLYMSGYARPVLGPTLGEEIALLETPFSEELLLIKVRDVLDNVTLPISAGRDRGEQLVEAMGGKTGATSQTGMGSSFWVELPVVDAPAEQPADTLQPTMVPAPFSSRAGTVLYVEDNPSNVKLVERLVAGRPEVTLLVAMEGRIALELAREHQPSLILLDLNLPDMSGEEVLRRLRAEPRTSATPVVVVSADATPGQVQRLRANGATDYLTKPFDIARLLAVIDGAGSADQPTALPEEQGSIAGPLDPTIVASLHALGRDSEAGPAGIHDVVTSFLDDSWSRFADLRIAVRDGDAAGMEQLAHSLVGSSANFGARNVAEGCREVEARARAGDLGDVPMLVARLEEAFTVARTALRAEFLNGGDPSP
jgi:CheY-like chemotaxis protein